MTRSDGAMTRGDEAMTRVDEAMTRGDEAPARASPAARIRSMTGATTRALSLALLLTVSVLGASAQERPAAQADQREVQVQLRLERGLLALDLTSYREARDRQRRIQEQVEAASTRMDEALQGESLTLGSLEALHDDLVANQAAATIARDRVEEQLRRLEDRMRRISFLEGEAGLRSQQSDPVTGRWEVTIAPQDSAAVFDLRLDGTVVSGEYEISGFFTGSFRGTYSSGRLRLERIDSRRGFDAVFEGTIDPATGRVSGSWTANELASGQPARGGWSGARVGTTPADDDEGEP